MKQIPKISDTEWQVMKVVWSRWPITANQVIDELAGKTDWKPKTIKTLLGRLVAKKALGFEKENRTYRYFPIVLESECMKAESRSFLKRVYDGALSAMLINFLEEQKLSGEEVEELKRILDQKKG